MVRKIFQERKNFMHTVNKIEKIQKKQWDSVNMTYADYNSKLLMIMQKE